MEEIIRTGYDPKTFKKMVKTQEPGGCYFCKRADKAVFVKSDEEGPQDVGDVELDFTWYEINKDGRVVKYLVCKECFDFLEDLCTKLIFCNEFRGKMEIEWGTRKEGGEDD